MDHRQVVKPWCVYVLRRADGALYTGITTDVPRRMAEHARGGVRGARSLRGRDPLTLVVQRAVGTRSLAARVEAMIKAMPRARKQEVIAREGGIEDLIRRASAPGAGGRR